jgi:hypothetical protein
MVLFIPSAMASLVVVFAVYAVARGRYQTAGACWFTAAATVVSLLLGAPALILHSVASFLLAVCCAALRRGPKAVFATSIVAMLASYGLIFSHKAYQLYQRWRDYPIESIVDRLVYEQRRPHSESTPTGLATAVEQRLRDFENDGRHQIRSLASLHDQIREDFIRAPGNGRSRMTNNLKQLRIELPPASLPAAPKPYESPSDPQPQLAMRPTIIIASPEHSSLLDLHDAGLEDFLNHKRMGYFEDRSHTAGFRPHRFMSAPKNDDIGPWQLVRLELVSLLKHKTPVVYVADYLPQMDKLKDVPTRPLSRFESTSLERIWSENDLVVEESPQRIRMLGSLRAGKSCQACHSVRRGELLGAFSYELVPRHPLPVAPI